MGTVALFGGRAFEDIGENRRVGELLLSQSAQAGGSSGDEVLVVPTADAFERPERLVATAVQWFSDLGASARPLMVLTRRDASDPEMVSAVERARFAFLAGDSPLHLRSALKDTPVWSALVALAERGVVAASGASAAGICDPMTDPRGGAFGLGLGLVRPLAVIHEAETWSFERLHRARQLASGFTVATLPSGAVLLRREIGRAHV